MYSIVLVSAGTEEWDVYTVPALASLSRYIKQPYQLITVDNGGCGRGTINSPTMFPYSTAANLGAKEAIHERLLILNNDITIRGDILQQLDHTGGHYCGPVLLEKEHVRYVEGWFICIDIDLWHLLNGFDIDYKNSWEDVDLAFRLSRLGIPPTQTPLPIHHIWGATRNRHPGSNQWDEENRLRLLSRMRGARHYFGTGVHKYEEDYITGS